MKILLGLIFFFWMTLRTRRFYATFSKSKVQTVEAITWSGPEGRNVLCEMLSKRCSLSKERRGKIKSQRPMPHLPFALNSSSELPTTWKRQFCSVVPNKVINQIIAMWFHSEILRETYFPNYLMSVGSTVGQTKFFGASGRHFDLKIGGGWGGVGFGQVIALLSARCSEGNVSALQYQSVKIFFLLQAHNQWIISNWNATEEVAIPPMDLVCLNKLLQKSYLP